MKRAILSLALLLGLAAKANALCAIQPTGLGLGIPTYGDSGPAWSACVTNDLISMNNSLVSTNSAVFVTKQMFSTSTGTLVSVKASTGTCGAGYAAQVLGSGSVSCIAIASEVSTNTITGVLPVAKGGTASTSLATVEVGTGTAARNYLTGGTIESALAGKQASGSYAASGANGDITSMSAVKTISSAETHTATMTITAQDTSGNSLKAAGGISASGITLTTATFNCLQAAPSPLVEHTQYVLCTDSQTYSVQNGAAVKLSTGAGGGGGGGTIGGSGTAGIPAYFSAGTTIGNAPTGAIVKTSVVRSCTQACASTNVIAPSNSALAYNTGTSGMTGSYTPTSASNKVRVTVNAVLGSYSYGTYLILSDDTATTLLGITGSSPTNQQDALMSVSLKSADLTGWSGSHTFDVRYGVDATVNWSCFNASYLQQTFGGGSQVCSTITFEEIAP